MNYRAIFNPDYNFVGLILIALIITILLLLNKNLKYTIHIIGKTFCIAGLICLVLSFIFNTILKLFIPYQYRIFIQVISNNVYQNFLTSSLLFIASGAILLILLKFFTNKKIISKNG